MNRKKFFFAAVIGLLLLALVFSEGTRQNPVNWSESYHHLDKIPLGAKVFYELFRQAEAGWSWEDVNIPAFEFMDRNPESGVYFLFNGDIYWSASTVRKLLDWVEAGNTVFISSFYPPDFLLDTLGLEVDQQIDFELREQTTYLELMNPHLQEGSYTFDRAFPMLFFTAFDSASTSVLGVGDVMRSGQEPKLEDINFIRVPVGEGQVLLHTFPPAFSNYFLLRERNVSYIEGVLAYLPKSGKIYYDHYYKEGKPSFSSPLYVILNNNPLKMAYYLLIALTLVWVFFGGRRRQKAIPVIPPLKNQSLDFTETLAGVYLSRKAHREVASHQINYLLEHLRKKHHLLGMDIQGEEWIQRVSEKHGRRQDEVVADFRFIAELQAAGATTEAQLQKLNQLVTFYTQKHDRTRREPIRRE